MIAAVALPQIEMALVNARVMLDTGLQDGLAVGLAGGRIAAVVPVAELPAKVPRRDLDGGLLLPGFIDTQVNGGGGALFNDAPTVATIARIGTTHRRFGTTGFLPTLISDDLAAVHAALDAMRAAITAGIPGVLGTHIEGPFLSGERHGIHDASRFRRLEDDGLELLGAPGVGRVLVTLAPEMVDPDAVRRLVRAGVTVAAGHTNASCARMQSAFADGVTGVTHLFNAMSPLTSREPGVVGAALTGAAYCGLIVDGRHVDPVTLRVALRCCLHDRLMLVTDAMPCVGTDSGSFILQDKLITVRDGACYDDNGRLAGSSLDMATAVRNAVAMLGLDLTDVSRMASGNPAAFLGLSDEVGRIAVGLRADLVLLDERLHVVDTWIGGRDREADRE